MGQTHLHIKHIPGKWYIYLIANDAPVFDFFTTKLAEIIYCSHNTSRDYILLKYIAGLLSKYYDITVSKQEFHFILK